MGELKNNKPSNNKYGFFRAFGVLMDLERHVHAIFFSILNVDLNFLA